MSKISIKDVDLYYDDFQALKKINMEMKSNEITAFIDLLAVVNLQCLSV